MAIQVVQTMNMNLNQLTNMVVHILATDPSVPVQGQVWFNSSSKQFKFYDGTTVQVIADLNNAITQFAAPSGSLNMNSQTIQNVGTPVNSTDAANKAYVDAGAAGLTVKASVVAATTTSGTLASSFASGQIVDGVTLATGNRILIKNQGSVDNGIYTVNATGAPTRSVDCNSTANFVTGSFCFVEEGTINQGASFVCSTQGTITPGTTVTSWVQFSGTSATSSNLAGGSIGQAPYQSGASTTSFIPAPTTNGHTFVYGWQPTGSAAAPLAIDVNSLTVSAASTATTAGTAAGLTGSPSITVSGITDTAIVSAGLVASSSGGLFSGTGKVLAGAGAAVPTGPSVSVSGNVVTFTGTAGQIQDSGIAVSSLAPLVSPSFTTPSLGVATATSVSAATFTSTVATGTAPFTVASTTPVANLTAGGNTKKYAQSFGDGSTTTYVITHNLGTTDVHVGVSYVATPFQVVLCEVQLTSTNTVTLVFASAPTSNSLRVVVIG